MNKYFLVVLPPAHAGCWWQRPWHLSEIKELDFEETQTPTFLPHLWILKIVNKSVPSSATQYEFEETIFGTRI